MIHLPALLLKHVGTRDSAFLSVTNPQVIFTNSCYGNDGYIKVDSNASIFLFFKEGGGGGGATYNKHKYYYSGKEFICDCSTAKSVEDDDENENRISPNSLPGP